MKTIDVSLKNNFPDLKLRRRPILPVGRMNDIITAIVAAIDAIIIAVIAAAAPAGTVLGIGAAGIGFITFGEIIVYGAIIGLSAWSVVSATGGRGGGGGGVGGRSVAAQTSIEQNGQLINSRQAAKVLPIVYGVARVGCNWVFGRPSAKDADILNAAVSWSEGEVEGIATAIDYVPLYSGTTLNDIHTGGEFIPTTGCSCEYTTYGYSCACDNTCYVTYS